jgi:TBC1 domain family protein 5
MALKDQTFNPVLKSAGNVDVNKFNPLSKVTNGNPWTAQFENQNRVNEIKLDIDRTYQDMAFFKDANVQKSLINVLFVFGKTMNIPYRQGMNEIVAILFHAVSHAVDASRAQDPAETRLDMKEGVTYGMLSSLMLQVGIVDFFLAHSVLHKEVGGSPSPLLDRCEKIFDLLCQKDARLHKHLVMNDISPNLFLLRWIRLLFSREFTFNKTLVIWDHFFASLKSGVAARFAFPSFIDYFAIAMILNVRNTLLTSDNSGCFTTLLKYPETSDVESLISMATQLRTGAPAPVAPMIAVTGVTKRDRVVTDLASVIDDLRKSQVAQNIQREIEKLEEVVNFLRPT